MAASLPAAHQPAAAAATQYSLPAFTPEQEYVQKKQGEELQKDVRLLCALDNTVPFANLQDAVMRLLPFHLLNAADPSLADLDDTPDHMGADLTASRQDAWDELCMAKAHDLRKRAATSSSSIAELEARMQREALSGTRSIDHYAMARIQQEDLRKKIAADKAELQKLLPPPAAPTAPIAAAAGAGRAPHVPPGAAGGLAGLQAGQQAALQAAAVAAAAARAPGAGRGQQPLTMASIQQLQLLQHMQLQQQLQSNPQHRQLQAAIQQQALVQQLQQQQQQQQGQQPQAQQAQAQQAALMQLLQQQALQQQHQQILAQLAAQQQRKPQ